MTNAVPLLGGAVMAFGVSFDAEVLPYVFLLPLFVFVACQDFQKGIY